MTNEAKVAYLRALLVKARTPSTNGVGPKSGKAVVQWYEVAESLDSVDTIDLLTMLAYALDELEKVQVEF